MGSITITDSAAKHVAAQLEGRGKGLGIRLGVTTSGCSGMAYVLEFVDELSPEDKVFENQGVKVFIDPKSLVYLDGTEPVSYTHLTLPTICFKCRSRWGPGR